MPAADLAGLIRRPSKRRVATAIPPNQVHEARLLIKPYEPHELEHPPFKLSPPSWASWASWPTKVIRILIVNKFDLSN
jgi:hypothetical protein